MNASHVKLFWAQRFQRAWQRDLSLQGAVQSSVLLHGAAAGAAPPWCRDAAWCRATAVANAQADELTSESHEGEKQKEAKELWNRNLNGI